jgi:hypothetical protein
MFDHHGHFKQHSKICEKKTEFDYPGGFYIEQQSVFEELEYIGIDVPEDERIFPWFAVFDFESMLVRLENESGEKLEWTHHHRPISVSVCSNVPGHTKPVCFVNSDQDELLGDMIRALELIQCSCEDLAEQKWGRFLENLQDRIDKIQETSEEDVLSKCALKNLYGKFKGYMSSVPVLGFNR